VLWATLERPALASPAPTFGAVNTHAAMLPTSNTKIGQIQPVEPQPKKKKEPRNLDDSFFREHRENAAATLAAETRFPPVLTLTLRAISAMQHAHEAEVVRLSNASIHDADLPPLIELLHRSECGVQVLRSCWLPVARRLRATLDARVHARAHARTCAGLWHTAPSQPLTHPSPCGATACTHLAVRSAWTSPSTT